jgi:hypothetical protein
VISVETSKQDACLFFAGLLFARKNNISKAEMKLIALLLGSWAYSLNKTKIINIAISTGVSTWHDPRIPRDVELAVILREGDADARDESEILGALPPGWERKEMSTGMPYFVDHTTRKNQYTDPRLTGQLLQRILSSSQGTKNPPITSRDADAIERDTSKKDKCLETIALENECNDGNLVVNDTDGAAEATPDTSCRRNTRENQLAEPETIGKHQKIEKLENVNEVLGEEEEEERKDAKSMTFQRLGEEGDVDKCLEKIALKNECNDGNLVVNDMDGAAEARPDTSCRRKTRENQLAKPEKIGNHWRPPTPPTLSSVVVSA